ncbi:MAG: type I 3-dehydroquinate dehydratase [Treponema sp.]|jgi:3-dehydroquinate dehydratase/shikimate dehydrogenase|nr:type I 3-dehydroquinate dehydratase [Treponema sp.]
MAKICLSLTAKTLERDLEILESQRKYIDIAELRVDCLDPDERFLLRRFPEKAGLPVILSIRRTADGGNFVGGEGARIALFSRGLAFAEADRRRNFAYVDLEEDLSVPSLIEAARAFGTRIIRSYHNMNGVDENLEGKLRGLRLIGDEIVKAALMPRSFDDLVKIYQAAKATKDLEKILFGMGSLGLNTRILAEPMGSHLTYAYVSGKGEDDIYPPPEGMVEPKVLTDTFRFKNITSQTKLFAVTGYPLNITVSPVFYNTVFSVEKTDAVLLPIQAESIKSFLSLAEELNIRGVSLATPHKETVLPYLSWKSAEVISCGACNTILNTPQGWNGYNTVLKGFTDSLLDFCGRKNLRWKKVTMIGAGGIARAAAAELYRLKARVLILNRTPNKAWELASRYKGFAWAGLDRQGFDLIEKYNDIIIQATSLGMAPNSGADPLGFYDFSGKELIMDIVFAPEKTSFLKRAEKAGCRVIDGFDMLMRQARYQYKYFMGEEFPPSLINRVGHREEFYESE